MATLAAIYDRWLGRGGAQAETQARWDERKQGKADTKLRPFPNDDIFLFSKRIDNSRVIREADPEAPKVCWKMIGGASASAMLLIGLLVPTGYRLMAGYQIEELKKEHERLQQVKATLEVEEAKLLSPERLLQLAKQQELVDPEPGKVIHLEKAEAGAVAMRVNPAAPSQRVEPPAAEQ